MGHPYHPFPPPIPNGSIDPFPTAFAERIREREEQNITNEIASAGLRFNSGKPMMSLVDSEFIEGMARVLTFGAQKYSPHNWRKGLDVSETLDSAYRHLAKFNRGENVDDESGEGHLYHAACNLMFAAWMLDHRPEKDSRYRG